MRPILKPALPQLWRDETTLQLGADPARAVVLAGVGPPERRVLGLLDGQRTRRQVVTAAVSLGLPASTPRRLLAVLEEAGAIDDADAPDPLAGLEPRERARLRSELAAAAVRSRAPGAGAAALQRRRGASVTVQGEPRLGTLIAAALGAAGVGRVGLALPGRVGAADVLPGGLSAADVNAPAESAAAAALARVTGHLAVRVTCPQLVVLVGVPDPLSAAELAADQTPHLAVRATAPVGAVGPLVLPGGPCLHCIELHRRDRDPGWPRLRLQAGDPPADVALALATAGLAAGQALGFLDGSSAMPGRTLELRPPEWQLRQRSWAVHPECRCVDRGRRRRRS